MRRFICVALAFVGLLSLAPRAEAFGFGVGLNIGFNRGFNVNVGRGFAFNNGFVNRGLVNRAFVFRQGFVNHGFAARAFVPSFAYQVPVVFAAPAFAGCGSGGVTYAPNYVVGGGCNSVAGVGSFGGGERTIVINNFQPGTTPQTFAPRQ